MIDAATALNILRASAVQEKPNRGMPQYFETGAWSEAPPMLDFLSYYDQADDKYADFAR